MTPSTTPHRRPVTHLGLTDKLLRKLDRVGVETVGELVLRCENDLVQGGLTARELGVVKSSLALENLELSPATPKNEQQSRQQPALESQPPLLSIPATPPPVSTSAVGDLMPDFDSDYSSGEIFGIAADLKPRRTATSRVTKRSKTDDERAVRSAAAPSGKPHADHPRVVEIGRSPTMTVEDAAFVYGISRATAYAACRRDEIPNKRFGKLFKVVTALVFEELGLRHRP